MSETKDGGAAFPFSPPCDANGALPSGYPFPELGMTMRDWFAGQALTGIVGGYWSNPEMSGLGPTQLSAEAYAYADAMLFARAEGGAQ
ncbi:hypothetical protein [Pseudogemmobacter sonorensis]|uniref:hypothetical protein n=1 Tax=Pseudogemmobacter sonorensis TaxID=2989681 RepID=UPI0036CAB60F